MPHGGEDRQRNFAGAGGRRLKVPVSFAAMENLPVHKARL